MSDRDGTRNPPPADEAGPDETEGLDPDADDSETFEAWIPAKVGFQEPRALQATLKAIDQNPRDLGKVEGNLQGCLEDHPGGRGDELDQTEEAVVAAIDEATGQLDEALERFERETLERLEGLAKAVTEEHQATRAAIEDPSAKMDAERGDSRQDAERTSKHAPGTLSGNPRQIHNRTQAGIDELQEALEDAIDLNFEKLHQRISSLERDVANLQASLEDADDDNA